jgi:hypothetical protein
MPPLPPPLRRTSTISASVRERKRSASATASSTPGAPWKPVISR